MLASNQTTTQNPVAIPAISSKASKLGSSSESHVNYQNLNVVKRLSKAKFPVYLTASKVNKESYAMKVFPHKAEKPHPYYKNEVRFASLNHPNVVKIVYHEDSKDTLYKNDLKKVSYLLMEYAPHGDFFDFIAKYRQSIDEKLARTYFRQLIDGIEYLHSVQVAHLDLKPENCLMGSDFNLKIADFDLSHVIGDGKIYSKGTRFYRGPEFFKSTSAEPEVSAPFASDIYSAGIILFILKSGGMYPHSENTPIEGVDLVDLMYNSNDKFWSKHCQIQGKSSSFFEKDFRDLFNAMVKSNPFDRLSIKEIKESKWYNGPVYTNQEMTDKMKKLFKC